MKLIGVQLEAGMIGINSFQISVPESPFGGIKESGHGSEEGTEGMEVCMITKFISEVKKAYGPALVKHDVRTKEISND